jgi:hypothetical protein
VERRTSLRWKSARTAVSSEILFVGFSSLEGIIKSKDSSPEPEKEEILLLPRNLKVPEWGMKSSIYLCSGSLFPDLIPFQGIPSTEQ